MTKLVFVLFLMGLTSWVFGAEKAPIQWDATASFGMDNAEWLREVGSIQGVIKLEHLNLMKEAIEALDKELELHPDNRIARLERAKIHKATGCEEKSNEDLEFLMRKYPDFQLAYYEKAKQMLESPIQKDGNHPILDWLGSNNRNKVNGALNVVRELILEHQRAKAASKTPTGAKSSDKAPEGNSIGIETTPPGKLEQKDNP